MNNHYPFRNLALQSGGVLGTAYVGALKVLDSNDILTQIERVAGSSAGSIVGLLVSLRYTPQEMEDIMFEVDYSNFLDGQSYLNLLSTYGVYRGKYFLDWLEDIIADSPGLTAESTFTDLRDHGYRYFYCYGTDVNAHRVQEFSLRSTPTVKLAEAVRASMSIPMYFDAWEFPDGVPNDHLYADGGLLVPYPISVFDQPPFLPEPDINHETIGLSLSYGPRAHTHDFGYNDPVAYIENLYETMLSPVVREADAERSILIDTLGISAVDFSITNDEKRELMVSGIQSARRFLQDWDGEQPSPPLEPVVAQGNLTQA